MGKKLLLLPVLIAVVAVAVFVAPGLLSGRDAHEAGNARLLAQLPVPPEAHLVRRELNPYYREGMIWRRWLPAGWVTRTVYELPATTTAADVVRFYRENAPPGWEVRVDTIPEIDLLSGQTTAFREHVVYMRGEAIVSILVDNLYESGGPHVYEVAVDHDRRS